MNDMELNWDSVESMENPFSQTKKTRDERFYKLTKDDAGNGSALIRFLPDADGKKIIQLFKINTTIINGKSKRFVNELSPQSIGLPCPFKERWSELRNSDRTEESKVFNRKVVYYTNIKVLKDPKCPQNEGKIFLLEMSNDLKSKVELVLAPTEEAIALGQTPKSLFNPVKGNSFLIAARKGANGITNYNDSKVIDEVNGIYDSVDDALKDIKENTYRLNDFFQEDAYLPYEVLLDKLKYVTFDKGSAGSSSVVAQASQSAPVDDSTPFDGGTVSQAPAAQAPKQSNDPLDDLLNSLK